ncbi:MAG TPA: hypothetical protein VHB21_28050 [Minicystis sp.]|nr:hypothetical protein [Minicystis sp.]
MKGRPSTAASVFVALVVVVLVGLAALRMRRVVTPKPAESRGQTTAAAPRAEPAGAREEGPPSGVNR